MRATTVVLLLALLAAGCSNKVDSKINELAKKPAAATLGEAQALYNEVNDLIRWIKAGKVEASSEQLARAEELKKQREQEKLQLMKSEVEEKMGAVFDALKKLDLKGKAEWFIGAKDPRVEEFGCRTPRGPTDPVGAKGCK